MRSSLLLPLALMALLRAACGSESCTAGEVSPVADAAPAPVRIGAVDPRIVYVGRVPVEGGVAKLAWPATTVRARFNGTSLSLRMRDTPLPDQTIETDFVDVVVDRAPAKTIALRAGEHLYEAARGLRAGRHEVLVLKRTEAEVGTIDLVAIELDPGAQLLRAPGRPARTIELVGDSITAGFGDLGEGPLCPFSAATEHAGLTYGVVAARALGAEATVIAWSGKGVTRNDDPRDDVDLIELYDRALPDQPAPWPLNRGTPDVVVVNAGTNDFNHGAPRRDVFVAAYSRLLDRVRVRAPRAFVVVVVGPMLFDDEHRTDRSLARQWLQAIVRDRRAHGDARIDSIEMWTDPAEGSGCQGHPSARTHARLGSELATFIRERLGW